MQISQNWFSTFCVARRLAMQETSQLEAMEIPITKEI